MYRYANPGNTIASATSVCSGGSVTLSLQNSTTGSGVSYQWQDSPDDAVWTNIGSGGTSSTHITNPINTPTYFRCEVTCSTGPATGFSNSQLISLATPPVGGTASGPSTGTTYQNIAYNVSGQWQDSPDNSTWTNIGSGGTSSTHITNPIVSPTYFRNEVTCSTGPL